LLFFKLFIKFAILNIYGIVVALLPECIKNLNN